MVQWQRRRNSVVGAAKPTLAGSWTSALALFIYAACFSFAYISMSAATGALLLFGTVQVTMIGYGIYRGERLHAMQSLGLTLALAGLVMLMLPGLAAPSLSASLSMTAAGIAWGVYSLRGKSTPKAGEHDPTAITTGNFIRAVPMALGLSLLMFSHMSLDIRGMMLATASGALASGIGYAIWYQVLPALASTHAATVQLSVPVLAALGGVVFIGEPLTLAMVLASTAVLGGIALVIVKKGKPRG